MNLPKLSTGDILGKLKDQRRITSKPDEREIIAILADTSGSMGGYESMNPPTTKLQRLQDVLLLFHRGTQADLLLISFSDEIKLYVQGFVDAVMCLRETGGTSFVPPLIAAFDTQANRIILFTDGQASESDYEILHVIKDLTMRKTPKPIDTIGFGPDVNKDLLIAISELTGGIYQHARDYESLKSSFMRLETKTYYLEHKKR